MRFLFRLALVFIVICAVLSMIRGLFASASTPARRSPPDRPQSGRLVKDPVCGTYVAVGSAVSAGNEFFCSDDCRQKFLKS
jgi:hypothetical protein